MKIWSNQKHEAALRRRRLKDEERKYEYVPTDVEELSTATNTNRQKESLSIPTDSPINNRITYIRREKSR